MREFEYFRPETLAEAVELLEQYGQEASVLNGGTDLIVRMREKITNPAYIIDIKGIRELHDIRVDKESIRIGACVLLNDIAKHPQVLQRVPFLAKAARSVGSVQVRNRATCIGNLVNASPLADTATPLLSLDANLQVIGAKGRREIPLHEFFVFVRKTSLQAGEIVTSVSFQTPPQIKGVFQKMSRRKEVDLSTVCSSLSQVDGDFRFAVGAVAPTPLRLRKTELLLNSSVVNEGLIRRALEVADEEIKPISDVRASEAYRRELVAVMLERALREWL